MQKLTKKIMVMTLSLLMVFSMTTIMLHSLAESSGATPSAATESSSSSSIDTSSSSSNEESSTSEDPSKPDSSSLPDKSTSSSVSSSEPVDNSTQSQTNNLKASSRNGDITVDETTFPDPNFRQFVQNKYCNGGNKLTQVMIDSTQDMDCNNEKISDLTGIKYFTALTKLECHNNELESLDVSNNTELYYLKCTNNNQLHELVVSENSKLEQLYCSKCQLKELDVSNNANLIKLYCQGNQLTNLEVGNNKNLQELAFSQNSLTSLNVSNNTDLTQLYCSENKLKSLDVSNNANLTKLYCQGNLLTNLDLSNNTELNIVNCSNNHLTNLDTSKFSNLSTFLGQEQISTAKCVQKADGHYVVDMKDVVGADNTSNIKNISQGTMDANGVIDFGENKPNEDKFSYDYTNSPDNMYLLNVTLNLEYFYTVEFNSNGGSEVANQTVAEGQKATKPADPTKDDYTFDDWFTDENLTQAFDFNTPINENITLYAKWNENKVDTSDNNDSKVESNGNNDNNQNSDNNNSKVSSTATGQDLTIFWVCLLASLISVLSISKILNYRKKHQK